MSGRWSRVWIAAVAGFLIGADVVLGAESRPTGRGKDSPVNGTSAPVFGLMSDS